MWTTPPPGCWQTTEGAGYDKIYFCHRGVVSGLGKGITAASLGRLLKQRGLRVRVQKLDPYLNVDPGTMSPYQHGEVFVTDDGAETDLELGHYERFIDENLTVNSSVSAGRVYWNVLNRERAGDYLGGTVQIIPHITDEIKRHIYSLEGADVDAAIVEIGGTVGDIESQPFLGICLGMQLAVVEYARNVCGLAGAHSSELDPSTPHPVIDLMPDQVGVTAKGGTMRLGSYPCRLAAGSLAAAVYGAREINERHRHRYEFNNDYREELIRAGLALSGLSPDGRLVEVIELPGHPWFAAGQFHPELKSRPNRAHPLFREFVAASMERKRKADSKI